MPTMPRTRGSFPGRRSLFPFVIVAILLACTAGAIAQPTVPVPPALAARDPERLKFIEAANRALAHGQLEEAARLASQRPDEDAAALTVRGRIARVRGQYVEAQKLLARAAASDPLGDAALDLGLVLFTLGRPAEARAALEPIVTAALRPLDVRGLTRAARAAHALGDVRLANNLFRQAASAAANDPIVNTAWGELLLEKYNLPEALKSFRTALAADADHAPAHLGLARTLVDDNPPAAAESATRALSIDPTLVGAHVVLAALALDSRRVQDAKASLDRALAVNPAALDAVSLKAALAYLDGRTSDFEAEVKRVLAINPRFGEVYRVAGDHAARAYRFDEAVGLVRKAIALDPESSRAQADLGKHLLRVGEESEARAWLDRAFQADPYDKATFNFLALFDILSTFQTIEDGGLVIRLHPEEAAVMREFVLPLARDAVKTLATRYKFTPRGPLLIEMFPRHDDFAVRTVGLPGMIGAVGACFGRVVTLDSPQARLPPGSFNWAATLWHELAHVFTLQLSNQRVSRWVTEGTSVYEERRARAAWGRESEMAFLRRVADRGAIPLKELNSGFSDPGLISLAYYQASLVIEHIIERFGEEGLHKMLRAYADGLDDEAVLGRALGSGIADLQQTFDRFLDARFGRTIAALRVPGELAATLGNADLETSKRLAAENPGVAAAYMTLARHLIDAGDLEGAAGAYERAVALLPTMTGEESPRVLLAGVREKQGRPADAAALLEAVLQDDPTAIEQARDLARLAGAAGDERRQQLALSRIVEVLPFESGAHADLGRLALKMKDSELAVRSFRVALATGASDAVGARTDLAEAYLLGGRRSDAKREVIAALEEAPRYDRALDLLLALVDGGEQDRQQ